MRLTVRRKSMPVVSIRGDEVGPIAKPKKKQKSKPVGLKRGGKAPRKAGVSQEQKFANQYDGFRRVVASGAFGNYDPTLRGDLKGEIGRKRFLLEMKAWSTVDARGEKTINLPLSVLDKIRREADFETPARDAGVIFHPMNTSRWIAIFDWDDFYRIMTEQEEYIKRLESALDA
jgi:hypothetical protein